MATRPLPGTGDIMNFEQNPRLSHGNCGDCYAGELRSALRASQRFDLHRKVCEGFLESGFP